MLGRLVDVWRSSVARRILLSFVIAAAIPLTVLAGSAYLMVVDQLQERALRDAHRLARDVGMSIYDRLRFVSDELQILGPLYADASAIVPDVGRLDLEDRVLGFFRASPNGVVTGALPVTEVERTTITRAVATADRALPLLLTIGEPARQRALLLVATSDRRGDPAWIGAELRMQHLWDTTGVAGRAESVCVLGPQQLPVYCNRAGYAAWLEQAHGLIAERGRPRALHPARSEPVMTAVWSLFLKPHYQLERWSVVSGVPESIALASVVMFDRIFFGAALVALALAFILGNRMVRGNLEPLARLTSATRELANGQFAHRVQLNSGDEFQHLGDAFDNMAGQIGAQFTELTILERLDRELQGAPTVEAALDVAAECLGELIGPGRSAFVCQERWHAAGTLWCRDFGDHTAVEACEAPVDLAGDARSASADLAGAFNDFIRERFGALRGADLRLFPVTSSDNVAAKIIVRGQGSDDAMQVGRVADILGITLGKLVLERRLYHQANHDWLSGLPNRQRLEALFDEWVAANQAGQQPIGLLAVGVDRFKQINDSLGHSGGDQLLTELGARLREMLPPPCVVGRLEGDQFLVMLSGNDLTDLLKRLHTQAEVVTRELDRPFVTGLRDVRLTATMSAAVFPRDGANFDGMLQSLDAARYAAKNARRGRLLFFSPEMRDAIAGRMEVEQALKGAIDNGELVLHYQPVVDAHRRRVRSAEALMRWQRPGVGLVMPGGFIEVAEQSGLIAGMGAWAINEVCRQTREWLDLGLQVDTITVNVSSLQLSSDDIEQQVAKALRDNGLPPERLTLEVTETALIGQFDAGVERLRRLRGLGVRVLIDDFGTGYASLKYLKMLPVDGLKIDRLFVKDLPESAPDEAIVTAVVSLARAANLKLVAEGIETEAQAECLFEAGVPFLQGFLFDKALPADAFREKVLAEQVLRGRGASALAGG